ncbi:branched-chain amino acid ABC transporter permease [Candidatus Caldatribacterium sp.]|uniref:branched-chain amino acid ABC transporter permease n=1 Tax=Candidatus Caldatribacterium sp. TaxID=2282143 RepID=UPI002990AE13|nr:branched-chain amino acid ABC transporter permease [Candidatus Caldatribacterium sp.]MDW8080941.1 branched-chain amino acid ABC transporter permease [Candidatus Calescibacterium sp.]
MRNVLKERDISLRASLAVERPSVQVVGGHRVLELVLIAVVFLVLVPFLGAHRVTDFAIFCIFALSFDLLYGYMGRLSFGHLLYLGVGAYTVGLSLRYVTTNPLLAIVLGVIAACLTGMLVGAITVRVSGAAFALSNLAFNRVGWFLVMSPLKEITGGENGLSIRNLSFWLVNFRNPSFRFWFVLVSLLGIFLLLRILTTSPYGILLRSIKEDERRVRFLGYNTQFYKWVTFVIAASVAGFAGTLTALNYGYVNPNTLDVHANAGVVFACLIGGAGKLYGALLGGILYMLITNLLPVYFQRWEFVLGIALLLIVFRFRGGIWSGIELLQRKIASWMHASSSKEGVSR